MSDFQINYLNGLLGLETTNVESLTDFDLDSLKKEFSQQAIKNYDEHNENCKFDYWERRMVDAWKWCNMVNFMNILDQTIALCNPRTEMEVTMNIIYMCGSALILALSFLAKYKKNNRRAMVKLVWFLNAYISFRQCIRVFDFEETVPLRDNISDWDFEVIIQALKSITTIIVMFNCFPKRIHRCIGGMSLVTFTFYSMFVGIYGRENALDAVRNSPLRFMFGFIIWPIQIRIFQKVNAELIENL